MLCLWHPTERVLTTQCTFFGHGDYIAARHATSYDCIGFPFPSLGGNETTHNSKAKNEYIEKHGMNR